VDVQSLAVQEKPWEDICGCRGVEVEWCTGWTGFRFSGLHLECPAGIDSSIKLWAPASPDPSPVSEKAASVMERNAKARGSSHRRIPTATARNILQRLQHLAQSREEACALICSHPPHFGHAWPRLPSTYGGVEYISDYDDALRQFPILHVIEHARFNTCSEP